jgi:hypothetical protein
MWDDVFECTVSERRGHADSVVADLAGGSGKFMGIIVVFALSTISGLGNGLEVPFWVQFCVLEWRHMEGLRGHPIGSFFFRLR